MTTPEPVPDFRSALERRALLVADGAMGTLLHATGNSLDRAVPEFNLLHADLVTAAHDGYVAAGADLILTNTFGAGRLRLRDQGSTADPVLVNRAGAALARAAAARAGRPVFVGGSVSPAVTAATRTRTAPAERAAAVREQVEVLAEAGVDVVVLETFGYLEELVEAVTAAGQACDLPIVAQATFHPDGRTLSGHTPRQVARALAGLRIAAVGANCSVGPQRMLALVEDLREHTDLPISAQPNAGLPQRDSAGQGYLYHPNETYFAEYAMRWAEAGATVVGGCCGTTPGHIRATVAELRRVPSPAPPPRPPVPTVPRAELTVVPTAREFEVVAQVGTAAADLPSTVARVRRLRGFGVTRCFVGGYDPAARVPIDPASVAVRLQAAASVEAWAMVTTWDRTIMMLQAGLLGMHALGIRTVVCETGSPPVAGDYPDLDGVWGVDSVALVRLLTLLNAGRDFAGVEIPTRTEFRIGARFSPTPDDAGLELARTRAKVDAGVHFLVSRPVFDVDSAGPVPERVAALGVPVLLGLAPVRSHAQAEFLDNEVRDVAVSAGTLARLRAAGEGAAEVGLRQLARGLEWARTVADGAVVDVRALADAELDAVLRPAP